MAFNGFCSDCYRLQNGPKWYKASLWSLKTFQTLFFFRLYSRLSAQSSSKIAQLQHNSFRLAWPKNRAASRSRETRRLKLPQNTLQNERKHERTARKSRENTHHTRKVPNNPWNGQINSKTFKFVQRLDNVVRLTVYTEVERIPRISDCY